MSRNDAFPTDRLDAEAIFNTILSVKQIFRRCEVLTLHDSIPVPSNEIDFTLPGVFRHGDPNCDGDIFIRTSDGVYFCALKCVLSRASLALRRIIHETTDTLHGYPLLKVSKDAETVCHLLQALYPGPNLPIMDITLAYKCETAAFQYDLSPTIFTYDRNLFSTVDRSNDPIGLCVLAWNAGEWSLLEEVSRWALGVNLVEQLALFEDVIGGPELIAALLETQMERQAQVHRLVDKIPLGLICHHCRSTGRNVAPAFVAAIAEVFQVPYPNTASILTNPATLATPKLLRACRSKGCRGSVRKFKYTVQQADELKEAIDRIPQTILPRIVDLQRINQRSSLREMWEGFGEQRDV